MFFFLFYLFQKTFFFINLTKHIFVFVFENKNHFKEFSSQIYIYIYFLKTQKTVFKNYSKKLFSKTVFKNNNQTDPKYFKMIRNVLKCPRVCKKVSKCPQNVPKKKILDLTWGCQGLQ